jgi:hypothetical protein
MIECLRRENISDACRKEYMAQIHVNQDFVRKYALARVSLLI